MKLALENPVGPVFRLSPEILEEGLSASRASPRQRMLFPIHRGADDLVQRMVNFMQPKTYIQPHQHPRDSASETILVMQGEMGFVIFDEEGGIDSVYRIGAGELIDIEACVWHGVLALAPDTVILETKRGPYDELDKVFAEWAPSENAEGMNEYQASLESLFSV
ncbi:MAG: WbuC family cupin fold metalloprotein [Verrucomicrobiales bacterium]|nr:WbuC family cupin fold metalloprotein [Verrucomicrobiales bacterium]